MLFACNTAVAKAQLRGIYLDGDGEYLNIVASDGFRLAWDRMECNNNFNCIVPKTALQKLISFDMGEKMEFCRYRNSKAVFKSDEYTVSTSLIDGSFIDYKAVFRATPQTRFEVTSKTMLGSISRSLIASEKHIESPVILKRDSNREVLSVHRNGSTYSFNEEMMSEFDNDKEMLVGINAKYLVESIKATEGEKLLIDFVNDHSPLIINDNQFRQIILPVRLSERMREAIE